MTFSLAILGAGPSGLAQSYAFTAIYHDSFLETFLKQEHSLPAKDSE